MLPFAAMAVMGYLDKLQQQRQAREQESARILQQSASSLGAPTYNVEAAGFQRQQAQANRPTFSELAQFLGGIGGESPGPTTGQQAVGQDYLNNPYTNINANPDDEQGRY